MDKSLHYTVDGVQYMTKEAVATLQKQGNILDIRPGGLVMAREGAATSVFLLCLAEPNGDYQVMPVLTHGGMFIVNPVGTARHWQELQLIHAFTESQPEVALMGPNPEGPTYDITPGFWGPKFLMMGYADQHFIVSVAGTARHLARLNEINNQTWPCLTNPQVQ